MRCLLAVAFLAITAPALHAQGWIETMRPHPAFGVHKVRTSVAVQVSGRVATVSVEEYFRNDGGAFGEADYIYPLPGEAVFNNFSLFQGDQELRGETMDASQARSIYEEIVRRKRDPALIELAGHGLIRARVFPIATGETRKITLRYTQVLTRVGDALQFRYTAGNHNSGAPLTFRLTSDRSEIGEPFSPTNEVRVQHAGGQLSVAPVGAVSGDFDIILPLARSAPSLSVLTNKPNSEDGFFMLTLAPGRVAQAAAPRDITAVLDVSGSMSGSKIEQARAALHALLGTLSPADRFRLIAFSDNATLYHEEWLTATRANINAAQKWIDSLQAGGGTNIAGALREAFQAATSDARLPFVIFITDGLPSVGEQSPEKLADYAQLHRGRARVFAFGVGYDVNTYLLDGLSAAARGSTQYVRPEEDVERPISALATRIRFPVLTDLRVGNTPVRIDDVYPVDLPDLYADEELIILGRYHNAGSGALTVAGNRAGRRETFSSDVVFADHQLANGYIPRLWAARKVGYLSRQLRLHGENKEVLDDLRETALRYGVLSEYTSYLVQEPQLALRAGSPPPQLAMPMAASGQAAVNMAEAARVRREAKTLQAVVAADEADSPVMARGAEVRNVAGRSFRNIAGVWTDAGHDANRPVVTVEPFSDAYFAVLRALPELTPYWKALPSALVAGKRASIKVAAGGVTTISANALADLVKRFRM